MASLSRNDMDDEKVNPAPLVSSHTTFSSLSSPIDKTVSPSENQDGLTEVSFELNDPSNPVGVPFSSPFISVCVSFSLLTVLILL